MRSSLALSFMLLTATATVTYAGDRWEARASAGIGLSQVENIYSADDNSVTLAFQFDGGVRISDMATLGVHVGIAPRTKQIEAQPKSMFDEDWEFSLTPVHVGVMGQFTIADGVWIEPWVGVQNVVRHLDCYTFYDRRVAGGKTTTDCSGSTTYDHTMQLAVGLQVGVKVWRRANESISVLASIEHASARDDEDIRAEETGSNLTAEYKGFWLGVGYGF